MQSSPDRDDYINVLWENIIGREYLFDLVYFDQSISEMASVDLYFY